MPIKAVKYGVSLHAAAQKGALMCEAAQIGTVCLN